MKPFRVSLTDDDIIKAYYEVKNKIVHTDAPTEDELAKVRQVLKGWVPNSDMLSLNWLRNRLVYLRKSNKLKQVEYSYD